MIKVIIADDHAIIRRGIREILDESESIRVVDEAEDGAALLEKITGKRYDVVLLDINMPGRNGLDVLKDIRRVRPEQKVLVLSMYPEEEYAVRAVKSGASGYLRKDSNPQEIIRAVRNVFEGKTHLSGDAYDTIIDSLRRPDEGAPHLRLSDREREIFMAIGRGLGLSEIAAELNLSPKTVSTYRARIMEKMNMKNNAAIMKYVIENHLA